MFVALSDTVVTIRAVPHGPTAYILICKEYNTVSWPSVAFVYLPTIQWQQGCDSEQRKQDVNHSDKCLSGCKENYMCSIDFCLCALEKPPFYL